MTKKTIKKPITIIRRKPDHADTQAGVNIPQHAEVNFTSAESQEEMVEQTINPDPQETLEASDRTDDVIQMEDTEDDPLIAEYEAQMAQADARRREENDDDEPPFFPLRAKFAPPMPFPKEVLPPRMAAWAEALTVHVRGTYALVAAMLLSFLNLATQPLRNVKMWGQNRPITLFIFPVAPSGAKKTSIYTRLATPIYEYERLLRQMHTQRMEDSQQDSTRKRSKAQEEPIPGILVQDTTGPAIMEYLSQSLGSMGLFLEEAAIFLGGYSMQKDTFLAMIGLLSKLWDGSPVVVHRKSSGQLLVDQKRMAVMLAGQMAAFLSLLANPIIRQQGFLSRALITAPTIVELNKPDTQVQEHSRQVLREYDEFMTKALTTPLPVVEGTPNDLDPPLMIPTPEAEAVFEAFREEVRSMRKDLNEEDSVHDLINKHPEIAGRIAATFALVDDLDSLTIDRDTAECGVAFTRYFMGESIRIATPTIPSPHILTAEQIVNWMAAQQITSLPRTKLQSASLGRKLTVAEIDPAIKLLIESGWLEEEIIKRKGGGRGKHIYRLTRNAQRELNFPDTKK